MLHRIISFSVKNKLIVALFTLALIGGGLYSMWNLRINSMPDVTSNQVSVITLSPTLSAEEVEKLVTYPIELSLSNLPGVKEIRSISRFGLSNITVVFKDEMGTYKPRQVIAHQLEQVEKKLPEDASKPSLAPISTGLGEIYQYVLTTEPGYDTAYTARDLRTIQDWLVKRRMALTEGVAAVNSFGGDLKEYVVAVNPDRLNSMDVTITEIFKALQKNNQNSGSAYIQRRDKAYFIRAEGLIKGDDLDDIRNIVVKNTDGVPKTIGDVAEVRIGTAQKFGGMTMNGIGSQVGGIVMMLRGANSKEVISNVKERIESIRQSLPEGVVIKPFLDRSTLIERAIGTVEANLIEGGLIVIFVLVIILGSWRSGVIVGSVVPLSLLFAFIMMYVTGVRASLLSLGAIDFGIIVDGAVILTEFMVYQFALNTNALKGLTGKQLQQKKDEIAIQSNTSLMRSVLFAMLIIFIVFVPILTLTGVEGKMFKPMALTFIYALSGALLLCLFYVPMMGALLLKGGAETSWLHRMGETIVNFLYKGYYPLHKLTLKWKGTTLLIVGLLLAGTFYQFNQMGANFMPKLREGDVVMVVSMDPGVSLNKAKETSTKIEKKVLERFPEAKMVVSRIGAAEIPTDPHGLNKFPIFVHLKPFEEWTSASSLEELQNKLKETVSSVPGVNAQINQPINQRFNEMLSGIFQDIGVKLYGSNLDTLYEKANQAATIIRNTRGAADVKVEQVAGLPQITVDYNREQLAQYGLNIAHINDIIRSFQAGSKQGVIYEGEKRFDLDVKFQKEHSQSIEDLRNVLVETPSGKRIPLSEVADIQYESGPAQISRDNTYRRITVGVNARNRDTESLVHEIQRKLKEQMNLPSGYYFDYAGDFKNLQQAQQRLSIVVPVTLFLVFILLFFSLNSVKHAAMIFSVIPLAVVGGIWILVARDMDFSVSAGIGFIVLFGIAVLDGSVLMNVFNDLRFNKNITDIEERVKEGTKLRFRQVILVSTVAIAGFLPMATATSTGASIQRPLSTVVIGGLISTAILTLIVLPIIYALFEEGRWKQGLKKLFGKSSVFALFILSSAGAMAQTGDEQKALDQQLSLEEAVNVAYERHPQVQSSRLGVDKHEAMKKTAVDLGRTEPFYRWSGEPANGEGPDSDGSMTWGLEHEDISFPTVYIQRGKMLKERVSQSEANLAVTKNKIEREVASAYYKLAYGKSRCQLFIYLDSVYSDFLRAAELRLETGEASYLEKTSAEGRYHDIQVRKKKAKADLERYRKTLRNTLNVDTAIAIELDSLQQYRQESVADTSQISKNPLLDYYKRAIQVQQLRESVEKNELLPSLSVEYSRQSAGGHNFSNYRIGVGIPLWFRPQQGRIQAAQIETKRTKEDLENARLSLKTKYQQELQELEKHMEEVNYYQNKGLEVADELLRSAEKSFEAGEITYVEYVEFIDQAIDIKLKYLKALDQYNQSVIRLEYLAGN